ncbi:hypothetical protein BLOT_013411 [Blomia tropicalis]|nr:hypothetical protein BLOT_013411 [Blomia tropicalis]
MHHQWSVIECSTSIQKDEDISQNVQLPKVPGTDQFTSFGVFGLMFNAQWSNHARTSSLVRHWIVFTVFIIGSTYILMKLIKMFKRKLVLSGGKVRVIGRGINLCQQSYQYKDNPVERISLLALKTKTLITHQHEDVFTMYDVLRRGQRFTDKYDKKCLGRFNPKTQLVDWLTYDQVLTRSKHFSDGLLQLGLKPSNESCMGIYSINRPEYVISEYGCYNHSIVVIPIYDTLGANVASFIANQAEMTCITCDKTLRIDQIIEQASQFTTLKHIILMDSEQITDQLRDQVSTCGFQLHTMQEVEMMGQKNPQPDHAPSVNDLAIICYTSGTTSEPKGVMLTHENVIASVSNISIHLMEQQATNNDVMISILPLAHMFQRIGEASIFCEGGKTVYYSGDIQQLATEIKLIQPTMLLAVPRLLNRIHDAIYNKVRGNIIKKYLLRLAYQSKRRDLKRRIIRTDTIWDMLVFNKVRASLGGRVRLICVGSAPLSHNVLDFLRCALGCVISEGYGQTECVGPCTATLMGEYTTGHIGPPMASFIVKLVDFADMGYYAADRKGEILVKGPVVFKGYYKMPEKTAETLDSDGWLRTGDIGEWTDNGTLKLIDRKKNIFKLSQGEYIAPEKIENTLINSRYVMQIFVYGESLKSSLVAIVIPNTPYIGTLTNVKFRQLELNSKTGLNHPTLKEAIIDDFKRIGKRTGLKSFELPKNIYVHPDPFTIEQGLLTPTLKSKRNEIVKHFRTEIDALYNQLEVAANQ